MIPDDLKAALLKFRRERDWESFHTPRNLAISISLEASELLEHFQWARSEAEVAHVVDSKRAEIEDEVADLVIYLSYLCTDLEIDVEQVVATKLQRNERRFPV
jgi:NTP pyrophosphatase (non-canonical NTP hydrolase)